MLLKSSACLLMGCLCGSAFAAGDSQPSEPRLPVTSLEGLDADAIEPTIAKKTLGLSLATKDGRFAVNAWLRGQFRYSDPFDSNPLRLEDFDSQPGDELEIRRARVKAEGHLFNPRIGFYYEQELSGDAPLLDLRLDIDVGHGMLMRLGQYKVLYNREGIDSSGKQQFVDRSVATYAFTMDRQIGVTVAKHWAAGSTFDNWLMVGIFDGDGRAPGQRGDQPMVLARWQWQFLGEELAFSQSDYKFRTVPAASLSFGGSTVRGPYTRFSSSGGGQLDGFEQTTDDRYTLRQWLQEFAWQYTGMSIQQEFHFKKITDHVTSQHSTLTGGYVQFGKAWPFELRERTRAWELAVRVARVDWDTSPSDRVQNELTGAANLFLSGHNNKFTFDVSRVSVDEAGAGDRHDIRYRLQWDVSL